MPSIKRREFLRRVSQASVALLGTAAVGAPACAGSSSRPQLRRPNIVLIMADDLGFSDIGCYGGELRTPSIDGLAADGLRFTHFHNTARCCPSRASLLTGLHPHQAGVGAMLNDAGVPGYRGDLNRTSVTLAEVLKSAGYRTFATGKWHVTRFLDQADSKHNWPCQRGFDRYFGTINGAGSFFEPRTLTLDNEPVPDEQLGPHYYYTDAIAEHAVQFVGEHLDRDPDTPFFLYQTFTAPHWPLHATDEDLARTRGRFDSGWDRLRHERHERMLASGIVDPRWALTQRDERVPAWEQAEHREWQLRRMEVYAAQVESMDRAIGRLVDELRRRNALDDTIILFLSDNGGCAEEINTEGWYNYIRTGREQVSRDPTLAGMPLQVGNDPGVMPGPLETYQSYGIGWANVSNTPFRLYKSAAHTGGVATPLVVHWPAGISTRNALTHQPGSLVDIMATFVELAGATYPRTFAGHEIQPMEGISLVPVLRGGLVEQGGIFVEHEGSRAIIRGPWKAVGRGGDAPWELYDMQTDRTETRNLASQYPRELERLTTTWDAWAHRVKVFPKRADG